MTTPLKAAEKFNMLTEGDRVLVALSGGADSMCLLHCLAANAKSLGIAVCAAHYNHRLRGEESERDAAFAEAQCSLLGVPFLCGSGDVKAAAEEKHLGIEEAAREMRYAFLGEAAEKLGCNKIATAHNADDNAETLLLNLCRGGGAKGLSGIPPVRENIIRPLLMSTREEIEAYLKANDLSHVEDSSNSGDDYTRNVIRHKVMPVLREINPAFSDAAMRASVSLREDDGCLEAMARSFMDGYCRDNSLPQKELGELPKAVTVRVFRKLCGKSLSMQHCEALFSLLHGTELACADVPGMRVVRDSGRLYFGADNTVMGEYELPVEGEIFIPEAGLTVKTRLQKNCDGGLNSINKFYFNYDSIYGSITLTSRREGDRIRLQGRGCTKSIKELFSERKLPQSRRNSTPVFRDGKGVIAVSGFGMAERCASKPGDTVLIAEIIKKESTGG